MQSQFVQYFNKESANRAAPAFRVAHRFEAPPPYHAVAPVAARSAEEVEIAAPAPKARGWLWSVPAQVWIALFARCPSAREVEIEELRARRAMDLQ